MRKVLGHSIDGRNIEAFTNAKASELLSQGLGGCTLIIGGTHGDERATVLLVEEFIDSRLASGIVPQPTVAIPLLNPDGYARDTRYNARGVDLNRNFPHNWVPHSEEPSGSHPLSEPESSLLHDLILAWRPSRIVSLHWALAEIDPDGPQSERLAVELWQCLDENSRRPYRLRLPSGAPLSGTPGSLGQWCGFSLRYPDGSRPAMITLELPHHPESLPRPDVLPEGHLDSVRAQWTTSPARYLAGVRGAVLTMLEAACRSTLPGANPA